MADPSAPGKRSTVELYEESIDAGADDGGGEHKRRLMSRMVVGAGHMSSDQRSGYAYADPRAAGRSAQDARKPRDLRLNDIEQEAHQFPSRSSFEEVVADPPLLARVVAE